MSNSDLRKLVIIVVSQDVLCYKTFETVPWFPQNYNGICIQSLLVAKIVFLNRGCDEHKNPQHIFLSDGQ
jgi:hypothetical protein